MKIIFLLIMLLTPALVYGESEAKEEIGETNNFQQGDCLTLQECLAIGIELNFDIQLVRNLEEMSDNNATLGSAGALPQIDLSAGYSGTLDNTKQTTSGISDTNNGIHDYGLNAGVNLGWTIFDGFSIRTNYKRLKEYQLLGELNTRLAIEDFISRFTQEYYRYVRQDIRLKNLRYAVSLSRERLRIVESHYEIGSKSRLDLQQAKVDLNSDRSQLMKQYETMHTMRTTLMQMLAIKDMDFLISVTDTMIVYNPSLEVNDISQKVMTNNTELIITRKGEEISHLDLKEVQSGRYPYMKVNGGYGYNRNWYGGTGVDRRRRHGLNYGVTLGVNLFDGMNQRRRERNARLEIANSKIRYEQVELALRKDLSDQWMSYQNNIKLTALERDNLETARDNYEIAMERYRLGQLSGIELREAQTSLLDAEERLVQSEYETKLCEIELMRLSGQAGNYLENSVK